MNRISKSIIATFCMALLIVPIGAMTTEPTEPDLRDSSAQDLRDSSAQCITETLELMKSDTQESGCQLAINQAKLLIAYERLYEANDQLLEDGVPLGGVHINVETNTLYVSLTDVEEKYTQLIAGIVPDDVNLQFLEVEHTLAELEDAKDKLDEKMASGCINITLLGIDIKDNELMVGFAEITYSEIEAVRLIVGNVSTEFIEGELVLDAGKRDRYRPVFGGIQVTTRSGRSTLSYGAVRHDGTRGFVMTGHVGGVNTRVYQPTIAFRNFIGSIFVNPIRPRLSDAAFVPTTAVRAGIWRRSVSGIKRSPLTPPGTRIGMEGITSCGTVGVIHARNVRVPNHPIYGTLRNQVLATYPSAPGDSGGPVFLPPGQPRVFICGTHWGRWRGFAVYSPIEGVMSDLGLRGVLIGG